MEAFQRAFDTSVLKAHLRGAPGGALAQLFRRWALPGEKGGSHPLRIALRNGYLSLYVGGQSVARIDPAGDGITVTMHRKYYEGWGKGTEEARSCAPQNIRVSDATLRRPEMAAAVARWISTAWTYCGDEKLFVNDLIAVNPAVVDIEMALPGDGRLRNKAGKKVAPRMDLVTVVTESGVPCINFWEAKCASNQDLRARAEIDLVRELGASVAEQLNTYEKWLALDGRAAQVSKAFQEAGRVFCELADISGKDPKHPAVQAWARLAAEEPRLALRPAVVIGNYTPRLSPGKKDQHAHRSGSFVGLHRNRLLAHGITVIEVAAADNNNLRLPSLPCRVVV